MWLCVPVACTLKIGFVGLADTDPVIIPVEGNMRFPRTGNDPLPSLRYLITTQFSLQCVEQGRNVLFAFVLSFGHFR